MTLHEQLNDCKIKLINEKQLLVDLEDKLKIAEKNTDKVRYPILGGIITSFIFNTLGHIIMSPFVVLASLLGLALLIPAYIRFYILEGRSAKIEEQIKVCKENIEKYEDELELLNTRYETQSLILERSNVPQTKMEALPIRINNLDKRNNKIR